MADIDARLKRALDGPGPQHKVEGKEELELTEGSGGHLHTRDKDVEKRLKNIEMKLDSIIYDGTVSTKISGNYVAKSTDDRPTGEKGDTLFLWDTRQALIHDGTDWREI